MVSQKPATRTKLSPTDYAGSGVWIYALVFLLANSLLSYGSFPGSLRVIIFLIGVVFPTVWAIKSLMADPGEKNEGFSKEIFPRISGWAWVALGVLALTAHFYRLESLWVWPAGDESGMGFYSVQLSEKWDWRFFYTFGQTPPLSIWASAGLYKLGCSGFFSLWFPSALVAVLTVGAAVLAARQFFSKSFSFILGLLTAVGYWPFLLGRVCCGGVWLPLWVCLCVLFLGRFLKASPGFSRNRWACFCGIILGLGPFTFPSWPAVVLWMGLIFFFIFFLKPSLRPAAPFVFVFFLLALVPFGWAVLSEGYGDHIRSSFFFNSWISIQDRSRASLSYISSLFWGSLEPKTVYDAQGGGMLNPLLGAAFFLGSLELFRHRPRFITEALGAAWVLFLLPGMLSMNVEMYRVAQIIPILLALVSLGLLRLLAVIPEKWRWVFLIGFVGISIGIDGARILNFAPNPSKPETLFERIPHHEEWLAYEEVEKIKEAWGPGLVFSEFVANPDESLFDMVYPENAAENPRFDPSNARWAALLMDAHYFPFVSSRLAGSQWVWLDEKKSAKNLVLGVIPLTDSNRAMVGNWLLAHHYFRMLNAAILNVTNPASDQKAQALFEQEPAFFKKDRFLESCYWERRGEFYYDYSYQTHLEDHLNALRQAIEKGYPAAQLYFKLGSLLFRNGDRKDALTAFRAALKADPQYAAAQSGLNLALSLPPKRP